MRFCFYEHPAFRRYGARRPARVPAANYWWSLACLDPGRLAGLAHALGGRFPQTRPRARGKQGSRGGPDFGLPVPSRAGLSTRNRTRDHSPARIRRSRDRDHIRIRRRKDTEPGQGSAVPTMD
jgi:hypothetical protein